MSATSSRQASLSPRTRLGIELGLAVFGATMLVLMVKNHGDETIPYHLLYFTFAVVVGFRFWPLRFSILVLLALTAISTVVFVHSWQQNFIGKAELFELPLMTLLVLAGVTHAWRRDRAAAQLERMWHDKERNLEQQREFLRDVAHAIRTPVTIAMGHLDLLESDLSNEVAREDRAVVVRQLERMSALSSRLLALARLETAGAISRVDVPAAEFVVDLARNWAPNSDRHWTTDVSYHGTVSADPNWLELALDALVENALKFTDCGDTIRLSCRASPDGMCFEVADSGPGIPDTVGDAVFERFWQRPRRDGRPGTGLGLSLVRAVAVAHEGTATVGRAPEGGALFCVTLSTAASAEVCKPTRQVATS
jgi:signal transduction histidine kinase